MHSSLASKADIIEPSQPHSGSRRRRRSSSTSKRVAATSNEKSAKRSIGNAVHHRRQLRLVSTTFEDDAHSNKSGGSRYSGSVMTHATTLTNSVVIDRKQALRSRNDASSHPPRSFSSYPRQSLVRTPPPQIKVPASFEESYHILPDLKLGYGVAGQVHQCIRRHTNEICAVKTIDKSKIRRQDRIQREIEFMRQVRHPNIVRMYDAYEDKREVRIVTELCRGGELFDKIVENVKAGKRCRSIDADILSESRVHRPACFRERDAARILRSLLQAVSYLHSNDLIHRDIKPENILFVEENDDDSPIKLIDFGLSIRHNAQSCEPLSNIVGTSYYIAPEVLAGSYGRACDLWSVGAVAYIMLSGRPPFNGSTDDSIFQRIRRGEYKMGSAFDGVSDYAKDFVRCLLDVDPARRWTADMALNHAWLKLAELEI